MVRGPVFKHGLHWTSTGPATLLWPTEFNGIHLSINLTLSPSCSYWVSNDNQSGSDEVDILGAFVSRFQSLYGITSSSFRAYLDDLTGTVVMSGSRTFAVSGALADFPVEWLGFPRMNVGAVGGGALSGSYIPGGTWIPQRLPASDTYGMVDPTAGSTRVFSISGRSSTYVFHPQIDTREITFMHEPRSSVIAAFSATGNSGSLETFFTECIARGEVMRVYDEPSDVSGSVYGSYVQVDRMKPPWKQTTRTTQPFYDVSFALRTKR